MIVRTNPETPCPADGAHHPHRWTCDDPACCGPDCFSENGIGELVWAGEQGLWCCVCGQNWPCETKRQHDADRAKAPTL